MDNSILISVIIPTFNRLEYFKIALLSALNQTYRNIEIIVTDDSTNDEIRDYIHTSADDRIKYYKNESQLGIALNTKSGITKSSGEYFAFLNDDDFWCETFLEKLVSLVTDHDKVGCIFSDHWLVDSTGKVLLPETEKNSVAYKRHLLRRGLVSPRERTGLFLDFTVPVAMACLIKKEIVDLNDYPLEVGGAYDRWLLLQCVMKKKYHFFFCDEKLTNYRVHTTSVSSIQGVSVAKSVIYILSKARRMPIFNKYQKSRINKSIRIYIRSLIKKGSPESLNYIPLYAHSFF
jgi:glycosyltransferase involved in cell wall biosynthesis